MGCTVTKPIGGFDPETAISDRDQINMAALGMVRPEMIRLFKYFHSLNLEPDGMLDLEVYLSSLKIPRNQWTLRIFNFMDALPGKHRHVSFVDFVLQVWQFLTMQPGELASLLFHFYIELSTRHEDTNYEFSGNRITLNALQKAILEIHGSKHLGDLQSFNMFEHMIIAHNSKKYRERQYSAEAFEGPPADFMDATLTETDFVNFSLEYPTLTAPLVSLQTALRKEVVNAYFWNVMRERAIRARVAGSHHDVLRHYRQERLARMDTRSAVTPVRRGASGPSMVHSLESLAVSSFNTDEHGNASKLTARTSISSASSSTRSSSSHTACAQHEHSHTTAGRRRNTVDNSLLQRIFSSRGSRIGPRQPRRSLTEELFGSRQSLTAAHTHIPSQPSKAGSITSMSKKSKRGSFSSAGKRDIKRRLRESSQ